MSPRLGLVDDGDSEAEPFPSSKPQFSKPNSAKYDYTFTPHGLERVPSSGRRASHEAEGEQEEEEQEEDEELELTESEGHDDEGGNGMTPLDETLEEIGMGKYQWRLLVLCGFGWLADNMWLQGIAVILPRVQEHFGVSDRWIGLLSASIFAGMMVGAWGWGSYSDSQGRTPAFNLTLLLTSIFGLATAFAPSFFWLCFALFWLGTGVGGSMPTDGTLFLENIPKTSHYLLTALSAFFSFGAVLTSLLGLVIIPRFSCPEHPAEGEVCDVQRDNMGWRYMLGCLTIVSITMFLSRIILFRLQESPKFLAATNRQSEAVIALERISRINGNERAWELKDVVDDLEDKGRSRMMQKRSRNGAGKEAEMEDDGEDEDGMEVEPFVLGGEDDDADGRPNGGVQHDYSSTGDSQPRPSLSHESSASGAEDHNGSAIPLGQRFPPRGPPPRLLRHASRTPLQAQHQQRRRRRRPPRSSKAGGSWTDRLPVGLQDSLDEYAERLDELFEPKWRKTTTLVWLIWLLASAGYTIFNVFLPKYLETKVGESVVNGGREQSLREYVLYTASGIPGSFLGAYLVETALGRIKTLAISTLFTSLGTLVFVMVSSQAGVMLSSMLVSLAATLMYAVIYAYTPEAFPTTTRGTACGIASAMSRLAGIVAPLITGVLLTISVGAPLFLSSACFLVTAACAAMLPYETRTAKRSGAVMAH